MGAIYKSGRPYSGGGGGSTYTAGDGIIIDNDEISVDAMTESDLQELKDAFVPNTGAPARMFNYSTDEQIVGTWIDGKPLYQKTVTGVSFSTPSVVVNELLYSGHIDKSAICNDIDNAFIDITTSFYSPLSGQIRGFASGWYEKDNGYFLIMTMYQRNNASATLTVQYTKTTD